MSQRRGRSTSSASTLSVAMVISGKSVSRFVSRICLGSSGRKGRKSEAPAMLNMLPKLALVAMKTYFSVLAKVVRPSRTPVDEDVEVLLQQDDVGGLLGHVHGALHRDADVGGVQRRGVVDPVAHVADDVARLSSGRRMMRSFWFGSISAKMSHLVRAAAQGPRRSSCRRSAPVSTFEPSSPTCRADGGGDQRVVAGDDLQAHARAPGAL